MGRLATLQKVSPYVNSLRVATRLVANIVSPLVMEDVSDPMTIGDVVLVNNDDGVATGEIDIFKQWKAHVLEIRAQDPQHVYLRVFWIYDPNELPGARRPYHGLHELVPSNDMAIIDAMTINGPVSVKKWNEYDDDDEPYTGTDANPGFFWRQTYNVHTGRLSVSYHIFESSASCSNNHVSSLATATALFL